MKRVFLFISIFALVVGLVGFLFNLNEYDLFAQLSKIEDLTFGDPVSDLRDLINEANNLFNFNAQEVEWYEYIPIFFQWIGVILRFPIILIKDIAINIYSGLQAILFILGFQEVYYVDFICNFINYFNCYFD